MFSASLAQATVQAHRVERSRWVPSPQATSTDPAQLYLLPLTDTVVRLLTHTVNVTVSMDEEQPLLTIAANYRLDNPSADSVTVPFQVIAQPAPTTHPLPQNVALAVDGQPLALESADNSFPQSGQVSIGPNSRRQLTLSYQLRLVSADLSTFRYTPRLLDAWAGRPESWRVTVELPGESSGLIPVESWLANAPEGWTYNGKQLQWLQEGDFPQQPFTLQWVAPSLWRTLTETRQLLKIQPTVGRFLTLGDLYNRLYRSPQISDGDRQRFYAQTLAAYADGITYGEQLGLPSVELTPLHRALAALYRSRSIRSGGQIEIPYVDLMVQEAQIALAGLPPEDTRRLELSNWLTEGLEIQLRQAQQQTDWQQAALILERMTTLSPSLIDPAWIATERQMIELQQAMTLLDQDNQDAAIALAGSTVLDESLLPPPENRAVFASWQVTVTLRPTGTALELVAFPLPGREETRRQVTDQLVQAWQRVNAPGVDTISLPDGRFVIHLPAAALAQQRLALSQSTPPLVDWALLRTLLASMDPTVAEKHQWLWQRISITQNIDLRAVTDQWRGVAALLERRAADVQLNATAAQSQSVEDAQAEIREQMRQIYLEREAQIWHNVVRSSTVRVETETSSNDDTPDRVWIVQLTDPPQSLTFQTEVLSPTRLVFAVISVLILILALAGLLWLLL